MEISEASAKMTPEWDSVLEYLIGEYFEGNIEKFCRIPNEKKVFECYNNAGVKKELLMWINKMCNKPHEHLKSSKKADELRKLGNEKFKSGYDEMSLKLYTESIINAPHESVELSLALGNRSAVLFRLQQFEKCIRDVDLAIKNFEISQSYPKLMMRKCKALCKLKKFEDGLKCFNIVKDYIMKDETLSSFKRSEIIDVYTNAFYRETSETVSNEDIKTIMDVSPPIVVKGENKSFPSASSVLELKISSNNRRVITRETVEAGDILFVESPFSFVILRDDYENHCQFCCRLLTTPIACIGCVECLYCDEECREKSYNSFHKWECNGRPLLHSLGVGHLAFKTVLLAVQNIDSSRYKQVDELVTHLVNVPTYDILQYALTATVLILYLEKCTDFLTHCPAFTIEDIGFRLLRHIIQIICNAFAIKKSSVNSYELTWLELSQITYATGLYPSAAMMNHSCGPNIVTSFYNNLLVVRANKRIEKGEEVFNCYGPHFRRMKSEERKIILKNQFFFDCDCSYCYSDDTDFITELRLFVCSKCKQPFTLKNFPEMKLKCLFCTQCIEFKSYQNLLQKVDTLRITGKDMMTSKNFKRAACIFEKCRQLQQFFLDKNDAEFLNNLLDLADCYLSMGDYTSSWKCSKESVPIVKKRIGECSIEYADIIKRTIETVIFDIRNTKNVVTDTDCIIDLLGYADDMIKIVEMNFGSWSMEYSSLQNLRNELLVLLPCHNN